RAAIVATAAGKRTRVAVAARRLVRGVDGSCRRFRDHDRQRGRTLDDALPPGHRLAETRARWDGRLVFPVGEFFQNTVQLLSRADQLPLTPDGCGSSPS